MVTKITDSEATRLNKTDPVRRRLALGTKIRSLQDGTAIEDDAFDATLLARILAASALTEAVLDAAVAAAGINASKIKGSSVDATEAARIIAAGAFTETVLDAIVAAAGLNGSKIKDATVDPTKAAVVADQGLGHLMSIRVAVAAAAQTVAITLTRKVRVIDFLVILKAAGGGASTVKLTDAADNDICPDIDTSAGADSDVFRAASIDDANWEENTTLKVVTTDAAAPAIEATILCYPVA